VKKEILILALLLFSCASFAKSYYLSGVDVDVSINEDGSFFVNEQLQFDFSGDFSFAYRDIPRSNPDGQSIVLESINVMDSNGLGIPHEENVKDGNLRILWRFSAHDEKKTFRLSYLVKNQIVRYNDVADFYWKMHAENWDVPASYVSAIVRFPKGVTNETVLAWGHGPSNGNTSINNSYASCYVNNVPARTFVEGRTVFPSSAIFGTYAINKNEEGLAKIKEEELRAFSSEHLSTDVLNAIAFALIAIPVAIAAFVAAVFVFVWAKYGREQKVSFDETYFHEPPSDLPPGDCIFAYGRKLKIAGYECAFSNYNRPCPAGVFSARGSAKGEGAWSIWPGKRCEDSATKKAGCEST
jgi:uncharacterized membrane protein